MESQELEINIKAFEAQQSELEKHHMGKFVVFHSCKLYNAYDSFDMAAKEAVKQFGKDIFLIRQVGKRPTMTMPASVAFRVIHAPN